MATCSRVLLQPNLPFTILKRFRSKINIQKPRKPQFSRQLLIDVCKPYYGPPKHTLQDKVFCDNGKSMFNKNFDNPFERILANECLNWFNTSKMVVFLHLNSISMEDKQPLFAELKKNKMHLRTYGKKIISMATKGTIYEAVQHLFTSHQNIIFGQPDTVQKMFKILKKAPQLVIMGGIVHGKLLSKNELVDFSLLPNIDVARSQLCSVLDSAGSSLVKHLNQGPQTLVSHLEKHAALLKEPVASKVEEKVES